MCVCESVTIRQVGLCREGAMAWGRGDICIGISSAKRYRRIGKGGMGKLEHCTLAAKVMVHGEAGRARVG